MPALYKNRQSKFGMTCKFHHPQPLGAQVPAPAAGPFPLPTAVPPPATYPAPQSLFVNSAEQYGMVAGNWPVARPTLLPGSYLPGTYGLMLFPPEWFPCRIGLVIWVMLFQCPPNLRSLEVEQVQFMVIHNYLLQHLPTQDHMSLATSLGASSSIQNEFAFPERPGQPECQYYMKYGDCKFGSSGKYHHPPERSGTNTALILGAMGFPPVL